MEFKIVNSIFFFTKLYGNKKKLYGNYFQLLEKWKMKRKQKKMKNLR